MTLIATMLTSIAIFRPLWHIGLKAPQYPEGIGMYIWADQITGEKPHDLTSLNNLNHYIGMKPIVPESIPELRFMPWILVALVASGLAAAATGRRALLHAWAAIFVAVSVAGIADFWRWGYDYGHDLDPTAAIKVPGMSYQPPLIGTKQLLNFQATSWPAAGGWTLMAAVAIALAVCLLEWRRGRRGALGGVTAMALAACSAGPEPIEFGQAVCQHCHMTVADPRYAAELVTMKHRVRVFDAVECLAAYVAAGEGDAGQVHSLWVADYLAPGELLEVERASFVRSARLRTPMDAGLVAVARRDAADSLARALDGEVVSWSAVLAQAGTHREH
jgi:copper chaperone NosL